MNSEKLLEKAGNLREKAKHLEAYNIINNVLWETSKSKDFLNLARSLGQRTYIWKHLAQLEKNPNYLLLAKADGELMVLLAEDFNLREISHTAHFILAKIEMANREYQSAINHYTKALRLYKGSKAERGDWAYHLGVAMHLTTSARLRR